MSGDSGIPATLGIRPKTWVKRRARLFEAWKNDEKKIGKIVSALNLKETLKRDGHACSRLEKKTIEKNVSAQTLNAEIG